MLRAAFVATRHMLAIAHMHMLAPGHKLATIPRVLAIRMLVAATGSRPVRPARSGRNKCPGTRRGIRQPPAEGTNRAEEILSPAGTLTGLGAGTTDALRMEA